MSRSLSNNLLAQMFGQNSNDPFLMLVTLSHANFSPIYLVNNSVSILSRGNEYLAFPIKVTMPSDDGESKREVSIEFDNVSLELIDEIRTATAKIDAKIEMILASNPDIVEIELGELKISNVTYSKQSIHAKLSMDDFLNTEMTSEKYTPTAYPGLF